MTAENALRFLAHEAQECRDHDAHEALCLLLPALCKVLELEPMDADDVEARAFMHELHQELRERMERQAVAA